MRVPFVDLQADHKSIEGDLKIRFEKILLESQFIGGDYVKQFEQEFAKIHKADSCIAVNSGTDALILGVRALGLSSHDEVLVPANTFIATALGATENNLKPVFVDCDMHDFGLNISDLKNKINNRTKAIIAVHLYGQPDKLDEIKRVIKQSGKKIYLIEDAAQAHGAEYKKKPVGTHGIFSTFSFYPAKNLGALGDGGALLTNDTKLAKKYRLLREYGQVKKYYHEILGVNSRLDSMQAAFLLIKLQHLSYWNKKRQSLARLYTQQLSNIPGVITPQSSDERKSVYHLYVIKAKNRNKLMVFLADNGITTLIHYPIPLHLQRAFKHLRYKKGDFPHAEYNADTILSLPMYPSLDEKKIQYVCSKISSFYSKSQ